MEETTGGAPILIENLKKSFGSLRVLEKIDLSIKPGEFVALVGQSGCGKSTLLRLISNLEMPDAGNISIGGGEINGIPAGVRFLFQEARLLPWRTVLRNVQLGLPDRNKERALTALRQVALEEKADNWPSTLSGGQKQRVSLARALVGDPKVLLLDEPLGALDALTRINMQALIEELWRKRGCTVVLVTHDVGEAVALADRVVLLEKGKITLDERVELARPRIRDASFAYYEKRILDKVMKRRDEEESGDAVYL